MLKRRIERAVDSCINCPLDYIYRAQLIAPSIAQLPVLYRHRHSDRLVSYKPIVRAVALNVRACFLP